MGFTWEADLHLYYRRAQASRMSFGDPAWNRELAARALLDTD
jgi:alkylation response protein AidB-like acyl-CoA dehydrogenase